jgi:hypothetical protein
LLHADRLAIRRSAAAGSRILFMRVLVVFRRLERKSPRA